MSKDSYLRLLKQDLYLLQANVTEAKNDLKHTFENYDVVGVLDIEHDLNQVEACLDSCLRYIKKLKELDRIHKNETRRNL